MSTIASASSQALWASVLPIANEAAGVRRGETAELTGDVGVLGERGRRR